MPLIPLPFSHEWEKGELFQPVLSSPSPTCGRGGSGGEGKERKAIPLYNFVPSVPFVPFFKFFFDEKRRNIK
jgi:hypothetical protein